MPYLPMVHDEWELDALRKEPSLWRPAVSAILRANGFADDPLTDLGGGNLVIAAGHDHVLKMTPPVFARELEVERESLAITLGALPIETPRLCAAGEHGDWTFCIVTRLPGSPLRERWGEVPEGERHSILYALGAWLRALHSLEAPETGALAAPWQAFVAAESAACVGRQARWGVPPEVLAGVPDLLAREDLTSLARPSILHADLNDMNVLIDRTDGAGPRDGVFRASGIIDFADAQVGDPLFDLITPALLIARGDRALLGALLDGYGVSPDARDERLRSRLTAYAVLHRFNKLTRYLGWADRPIDSTEALGAVLFPL